MKHLWFTFIAGLLTFLSPMSYAQDDLQEGDLAPVFNLPNQNGTTISLSDFKGQWVVLYFYPKNDTPGCTTEACSFRDNINRLIAQKAKVIGVSLDDQASHQAFKRKYELPFDLLADTQGSVTGSYNALMDLKFIKFAKRQSFIINPEGRLAKIYRSVDPSHHVRDVIEDLKALQASHS
ncbi:peroxiredoxin [Thiosulfativibrio zosterae]|uniref:thioredoxin-dependent peroxiredoxin n=1 Tax=Thiosulfativibrio zosterae TaxID=2675053 RepID=A0A6F8PM34_9GAMM|nr:peroxiredoxin [Thiosulfativibrio zosterae]BBP43169.1 peroxiredoxin [Thiosulfativibrio zosterae]